LTTFTELGINDNLVKALTEQKIITPTEIQEKSIPVLLKGNQDFIGLAQTGTGKTAAFCLPLLQQIDANSDNLQAIILCPTRELGQQTAKQLELFSKHIHGIAVRAVYGGLAIETQLDDLRYPAQIIVATPGRLIDLIDKRVLDFEKISHFILDEADEMLNMGFQEDIEYIRSFIPETIVTWMFSATMPETINSLVQRYLKPDFIQIHIDPQNAINTDIEHQYLVCKPEEKRDALKFFLEAHSEERGLIFCRTKAAAQELADYLHRNGYKVDELHGDLSQADRDYVMREFKNNKFQLLIATDIAARGLDVKELHFVIHYHLPEQREYFTHRSGRTGRAGKKGISLCIVFQKDVKKINAIANNLGLRFTKIDFVKEYNSDEQESGDNTQNESRDKRVAKVIKTEPLQEMITFYINMGKADEVNPKNLIEFLCAEAGLQKKDFGKVTVEKRRAYFEVHHTGIRQLVANLKDLVVDGKRLVLTRDEFESKEQMKHR
jgi:ATP-dependent RNA helicase DeaD